MKNRVLVPIIAALAGVFLLAGCAGFSLAEDVTPPPDYVPPTAVPTLDLAGIMPTEPLDLTSGEGIYIEKCAPCHGDTGTGDGPQAASLQITSPSLVSDSAIRQIKPLDWYMVVSQGRMQQMMPPFKSLSPQQIWETLAYTYSLTSTQEQLAEGKSVYEEKCAACHGPGGKGDGTSAAALSEKALDWSDPASLTGYSQQDLYDVVANGKGASMPAFSGQLNADQNWAAAAYIRQLGFIQGSGEEQVEPTVAVTTAGTETVETTPAPEPQGSEKPAVSTAGIKALVAMASGETLPAGLKAVLTGYEAMSPAFEIKKELSPDGSALWDRLDIVESRVYLVTVEYDGLVFRSDVIHGADLKAGQTTETAVEIYQTTSDASGLTVDRMHIFFDFPSPDSIQVVEMLLISNPGNAMVIPAEAGKTVIDFKLPAGYENLQFESGNLGERYLPVDGGFGDTAGIAPGSGAHQVLFAYELPYEKSAVIAFNMPLPVTSAIFMAPAEGITLDAPGLQDQGSRTVQDGSMHLYSAGGLSAGSMMEVKVSGSPGQPGVVTSGSPAGLFIGGGALVLALVGAAFWLMRRKEPEDETVDTEKADGEEDSVDSILDAIVALDDLYKAGKLPKPPYEERRAELKERLRSARGG